MHSIQYLLIGAVYYVIHLITLPHRTKSLRSIALDLNQKKSWDQDDQRTHDMLVKNHGLQIVGALIAITTWPMGLVGTVLEFGYVIYKKRKVS